MSYFSYTFKSHIYICQRLEWHAHANTQTQTNKWIQDILIGDRYILFVNNQRLH